MTDLQTRIPVTVRYFAAAKAAAGRDAEVMTLAAGATVGDLVDALSARSAHLARVLVRCSYLSDAVAVRSLDTALLPGQTVDVLPPFAGG